MACRLEGGMAWARMRRAGKDGCRKASGRAATLPPQQVQCRTIGQSGAESATSGSTRQMGMQPGVAVVRMSSAVPEEPRKSAKQRPPRGMEALSRGA